MIPREKHFMTQVQTITIEDDLSIQGHAGIVVSVVLKSGERRWCFFFNPEAFACCGDWIAGTQIPIHYGSPHMIVVGATLTEDLIHKAIDDLESKDMILACTRPYDVDDPHDGQHFE